MGKKGKNIGKKVIFALSAIPDQLTYQSFTFLVFTYYFAVVGINMYLMWIGYIIWGVWNAVNDPLLGALSDRTRYKRKFGKRKFYILITIIPLSLMMMLLYVVPPVDQEILKFAYFMFIIILFEGIYTMYNVNVNSLFPEMFPTESERASTNVFVKAFTVIGLIFAFIVPTLIISPMVPLPTSTPDEIARIPSMYVSTGFLLFLITITTGVFFVSFGIKEKHETQKEFEKRPSFLGSLKITLKNKNFIKFVLANTFIWYNFGMLPTIFPLFSVYVVGIEKDSLVSGIALMMAFLLAIPFFPIHK
ncbi:MAG: MFS transporter, partial [Promethearchaeota archaeon]